MKNISNEIKNFTTHIFKSEYKLKQQLWIISLSSVLVSIIFLLVFLPKILVPFYENNLYDYLSSPLDFVGVDIVNSNISTDVAFVIVTRDNMIVTSKNLPKIIDVKNYNDLIALISNDYGKFEYHNKTYYYSTSNINGGLKIAITNDSYIRLMKSELSGFMLPSIIVTMSIITSLLLLWNSYIVNKVEIIKKKMDNIDNKNDKSRIEFQINDELSSLLEKVEETKQKLIDNEEYKTQILQNISHELKTPITVIKSYIEGLNDGVLSEKETLKVIDEETDKLRRLVESLLYINKLDYLNETESFKTQKTDLNKIINKIINKYKKVNKKIKFTFNTDREENLFVGNDDMWEMVVENMFSNFIRYAVQAVDVSINKGIIRFYNDGKPIDSKLIKKILQPYEKGSDGKFGLGLTIVYKTIVLFGYNIKINNLDKGVEFIIK